MQVHLKWLIFPFPSCRIKKRLKFCILPNRCLLQERRVFTAATCDNGDSRMLSEGEYLLPENKLHKLHTVHPHEKTPAWRAGNECVGDPIDWMWYNKAHFGFTSMPVWQCKYKPFHSAQQNSGF